MASQRSASPMSRQTSSARLKASGSPPLMTLTSANRTTSGFLSGLSPSLSNVASGHQGRSPQRATLHIHRENAEAQTEATFYPNDVKTIEDQFTEMHCEEYEQLKELQEAIQASMTDLGGSIYDTFAFKDLMIGMTDKIPEMPIADILLISSKLFRRGSALAQQLSALFNIVFSKDFVDEHFKFTESRLLKKELSELRAKLETTEKQRDELQQQYTSLSSGTRDHQTVVESLQNRNDALEQRSATLEDQMAVLFQQLADDFVFYNEGEMKRTATTIEIQEQLSAPRSTFSQSIDAVQNRLRFFQGILGEIQEDTSLLSMDNGGSGLRSKIKALDVHVQHIIQRFSSVREGLLATSNELVSALQEKRQVLNFSLQHLKLYDTQNQKLRAGRALMHDLRQRLTDLERALVGTFATGSLIRVDRSGGISIVPPQQADGTEGKRPKHAVTAVRNLATLVEQCQDAAIHVTTTLDSEEEQQTLLRAISMAVPSTIRDPEAGPSAGTSTSLPTSPHKKSLAEGRVPAVLDRFLGSGDSSAVGSPLASSMGAGTSPHADGGDAPPGTVPQEEYQRMRDDVAVKLTFMREVYEERISDLESKVERAQKKMVEAQNELAVATGAAVTRIPQDLRDIANKAKEEWVDEKNKTMGEDQDARHDANAKLDAIEDEVREEEHPYNQMVREKGVGGGSARVESGSARMRRVSRHGSADKGGPATSGRSYVSPLVKTTPVPRRPSGSAGGEGVPGGEVTGVKQMVGLSVSNPPKLARTAYSREQQQKNAQVLRTVRRLTTVGEKLPDEEDSEAMM